MAPHQQILTQCRKLIPPLSGELHKGQAGRVGVLGGSKDYAGAPYFSSMASLRLGADLAHVICEPSAGNVIKTYSPDLIVHTDLSDDSTEESMTELLKSLLPRLHVLVIGPGLGRSKTMQLAAKIAIKLAREKSIYLVIDADGLWLIQSDPDIIKGYSRAVLTPNVVEFKRLCDSVKINTEEDSTSLASKLSKALGGVTILQKGSSDRITNGKEVLLNSVEGSVRRCGGQGDVLSGLVGTFLAWGKNYEEGVGSDKSISPDQIPLLAAYAGSTLTRHASKKTFLKLKRAMQTSDMLGEIGESYEEVFFVGEGERVDTSEDEDEEEYTFADLERFVEETKKRGEITSIVALNEAYAGHFIISDSLVQDDVMTWREETQSFRRLFPQHLLDKIDALHQMDARIAHSRWSKESGGRKGERFKAPNITMRDVKEAVRDIFINASSRQDDYNHFGRVGSSSSPDVSDS